MSVPVAVPEGLLKGKGKAKPVTVDIEAMEAQAQAIPGPNLNGVPMIVAAIPMALAARLLVDVKGEGGWQTIWRKVKQGVVVDADNQTATIVIEKALAAKVVQYAVSYGGGGYQSAFRWLIACLVKSAGPL